MESQQRYKPLLPPGRLVPTAPAAQGSSAPQQSGAGRAFTRVLPPLLLVTFVFHHEAPYEDEGEQKQPHTPHTPPAPHRGGRRAGGRGRDSLRPCFALFTRRGSRHLHIPPRFCPTSPQAGRAPRFPNCRGRRLKTFSHTHKWLLSSSEVAAHFCTCESLDTVLPPLLVIPNFTKNFPGTWGFSF